MTPSTSDDREQLEDLDWHRSLHPAMAGWAARPDTPDPGTATVRTHADPDRIVGVVEARPLPGYDGVANVSMFTDTTTAPGGAALEAYALVVDALFDQDVRLVHHEVLSLNGPIRRILRGMRLEPSARYRSHGYAAGRWWDVLVFSYDVAHWRQTLDRLPRLSLPS